MSETAYRFEPCRGHFSRTLLAQGGVGAADAPHCGVRMYASFGSPCPPCPAPKSPREKGAIFDSVFRVVGEQFRWGLRTFFVAVFLRP